MIKPINYGHSWKIGNYLCGLLCICMGRWAIGQGGVGVRFAGPRKTRHFCMGYGLFSVSLGLLVGLDQHQSADPLFVL
jgi:hypothetical protein